ncbi:adenosylmethionine-8-amino-7-oxononanoate aminotransferase [Corynebacterium phocae]|uniref:Adenosylmethionine-8-amino-7-oxononanoate aminotransferase n=1 Tax=Corynebacterium phocae TaxID=161895 RepID=A0A1L7D1Q3_9CORY|nr:adenosylmethionine--8-amino-7-oxononanoate transaminase [Corynebacterium phocae]APT92020.1 adenosylmethionine-8-amino-7-oxononanoate aminotransferase [Corynebacterium phocae]KAA8726396.1 adenosylmethionine--8-amino-7-oxononanoate transaminase [Corynebacterium phocae]
MKKLNSVQVAEIDAQHIWHPYAAPGAPAIQVVAAEGNYLTLADGRTVIDGMSSWWAVCHGHSHPRLVNAAKQQIEAFSHVMFGGLTHEPAARLTANLMELTRGDFSQVFYSDSGSVAVEVAVKMALQYSRGIGKPERTKLLTWRSGYHGDTFAAMSVCDPEGGMHSLWQGVLAQQIFAPAPPVAGTGGHAEYLAQLDALVSDEVAAIIIEPGVQGAGGMRFHDLELVAGLREICDRHGILLIADEIATGFGRAGELFMTQAAGITADILCVGKALTGGFMSLAATLATEKVATGMQPAALMHGPTFMANPLACAVAAESTEIIKEGHWRTQVANIESWLKAGLANAPGLSRVRGAIGVMEMDHPVDMAATTAAALDEGVWLRPFGRLIYAMPSYISTEEEVARICRAMIKAGECA